MKFLCFLRLHLYGAWNNIQEVPIWHREGIDRVTTVGSQPLKEQFYSNPDRSVFKKLEPDIDFRLIGKVIEQRRTCVRAGCHYTQVSTKRWKV